MSEPNFAQNVWSAERIPNSDRDRVPSFAEERSPTAEQLILHLDLKEAAHQGDRESKAQTPKANRQRQAIAGLEADSQLSPAEQRAIVLELMQLRSLTHEQFERIGNLEQALDQSLKSLKEQRLQMVDQDFLENQLASTEEIANIQQRAINQLKSQLAQQQEALEVQNTESQTRDRTLQELLVTLETLAQGQQAELARLRTLLIRERAEAKAERQQLEAQLAELQETLQAQKQPTETTSVSTLPALEETVPSPAKAKAKSIDPIEQELAIAQGKIEELETQIAKQMKTEAMLQHACQELEADRDQQQARLADLEQQTAEMQEQILKQAQQASEYETAVQHWKDRYVNHHSQMQQLKNLLEQTLPNLPDEIQAILMLLQTSSEAADLGSPALLSSRLEQETRLDLPEFLVRRRNYKTRRS